MTVMRISPYRKKGKALESPAESSIEILLATYNGERYIAEQIESIQRQTVSEWRLLISDDCSTDHTVDIIQRYAQEDSRITIISTNKRYGSAQANFSFLLSQSTADRVLFSDQDDIWHEDKIELFLAAMEKSEQRYGADVPLLVFSDLVIVNAEDEVIAPSSFAYINLDPHRVQLNHLLVQNLVTGCACCLNRNLVSLIQQGNMYDGTQMIMHDWCYAIIAAATGHVVYLDKATVDYRQHGNNAVGAHHPSKLRNAASLLCHGIRNTKTYQGYIRNEVRQSRYIMEELQTSMPVQSQRIIADFCAIPQEQIMKRLRLFFRDRFWRYRCTEKIYQFLALFGL